MDESPVINDSDAEFVPLGTPPAPSPSPVINDSDEFVPMPTPDRVVPRPQRDKLDTVPFEFADIQALAQRILKRATERGQAILASAQKQVADMEKAAYDKAYADALEKARSEGFAKGEAEGKAQAEQKITAAAESEKESLRQNAAPVMGVLQELTDALNASRQQLMAQAEGDLLLLALDLAKRLVGHELSVDPEAIKPLAVECIGLVTDRTGVTARVNPEDRRVLEEFYPELKSIFPDLGPLNIVADPEIARGGLVAATREAEVDMRLATRLASFEDVILGFSGEEAVAPWSRIPEDAIVAAREAGKVSQYSIFDDAPEAETGGHAAEAHQAPDAGTPAPENAAETDLGELADALSEERTQPDGNAVEDLADLSELVDLTDDGNEPPGQ